MLPSNPPKTTNGASLSLKLVHQQNKRGKAALPLTKALKVATVDSNPNLQNIKKDCVPDARVSAITPSTVSFFKELVSGFMLKEIGSSRVESPLLDQFKWDKNDKGDTVKLGICLPLYVTCKFCYKHKLTVTIDTVTVWRKAIKNTKILVPGTMFNSTDMYHLTKCRHVLNRIMYLHAPEWTGEVRSITYSNDGKSVSVVYRVTVHGIDSEVYCESTGTASMEDTSFGDPVQKAEAMAFRRACARLGLGLHLYHEDLL